MNKVRSLRLILLAAMISLCIVSAASGKDASDEAGGESNPGYTAHNRDVFLRRDTETSTLTRDWFGRGAGLRAIGITSTLNLWITYQGSVGGEPSGEDDQNGLYWFANHVDLERLVGLRGAAAYVLVEGGWNGGLNSSVQAIMNVNGMAVGDEPIGVTRLWYDQALLDERFHLRLGKLDMTSENFEFHERAVAIDAMPYGNSPRTQFLSAGLGNNASVPFPAAALGGMLLIEPVERWYVAAAGVDRQPNAFDWSYGDAFESWMAAVESGIVVALPSTTLTGSYYVGYWYSTFAESPDGQGVYVGAAQELYEEPGAGDQGLGLFARYGYADDNPRSIQHYWSLGGQYQGLIPGRDTDILAAGWAQSFFEEASADACYEGVVEVYYRARLLNWLHVSPHFQYVPNPGRRDGEDVWVLGVRGQLTF